jgi:Fe-S-cluster containining protein
VQTLESGRIGSGAVLLVVLCFRVVKLTVLSSAATQPWYSQGLQFTCTQCGNCCTGSPGYVWISRDEIVQLAEYLQISPEETVETYCRKIDGRFSLKESRGVGGAWDCIFLRDEAPNAARDGKAAHPRRVCGIYPVRPTQCRTWPFWDSNLTSAKAWERASHRCYGMNRGEQYSQERIEAIRRHDTGAKTQS